MDYQAALQYLDAHIGLGVRPGLDRIRSVLDAMGNPDQGYPTIHIAGTNGKTSTSKLTSMILVGHGLNTGTFTSPHLESVRERLAVNGRDSTEVEFAQAVSDVAGFLDLLVERGQESLTYFELTAAAAFAYFADQAVNAAVVEVGLGGRLDATNVLAADVNVVTSIGVDHAEYLGTEVAAIAGEKLGIVDAGSILVTGDLVEPALDRAIATAKDLGIQHRRYGRDFRVSEAKPAVGGWLVDVDGAEDSYEDLFLPLHGRHQTHNLAVAVASAEALVGGRLDESALREGISGVSVPGRMELIGIDPPVLLDGAHNPDGIAALRDALLEEFANIRWVVVFGVMADKEVGPMIRYLGDVAASFVVTAAETGRAADAGEVAETIRGQLDVPVLEDPVVARAVETARGAVTSDLGVLVTGSLYVVGEARAAAARLRVT